MTISSLLQVYMQSKQSKYEVIAHRHSRTSLETAHKAGIPGDCLAKCVALEDDGGYLMAVLPATHQLDFEMLYRVTGRRMWLANESDFMGLFPDCELGAMPALAQAYGLEVAVDETLRSCPDIYFEGGNHEAVIHMTREQFFDAMGHVACYPMGRRMN